MIYKQNLNKYFNMYKILHNKLLFKLKNNIYKKFML